MSSWASLRADRCEHSRRRRTSCNNLARPFLDLAPARRYGAPCQPRPTTVSLSLVRTARWSRRRRRGASSRTARGVEASRPPGGPIVFTHTTVVTVDAVQRRRGARGRRRQDRGDRPDRCDPQDVSATPRSTTAAARRSSRASSTATRISPPTLERGFNEDFGFPNSARLAVQPSQPSSGGRRHADGDHRRAGSASGPAPRRSSRTPAASAAPRPRWRRPACAACSRSRSATARTSPGPMSPEGLAKSAGAAVLRRSCATKGMQRISDLFTAWHGKNQGRISVFPAAALAETSSPELLKAVRAFAEKHDLGYTIHLSQSRAEVEFMMRHHGLSRRRFSSRHGFLGPRLFAAHCRYVDDADIALLGKSGTIVIAPGAMAANRGVIPPIAKLRAAGCPDRQRHRQQHQRSVRGDAHRAADRTDLAQRSVPGRAAAAGRHARGRDARRRARGASGQAGRLARGREEGRPPGRGHAARPPRAGGPHRVGVDPQRPAVGHRVGRWSTVSSSCATARS